MASIIFHGVAAAAIGKIHFEKLPAKILLAGIVCAILPDADAIGFHLGVPYQSMFGHRGITHSIFFALVVSIFISKIFFNQEDEKIKNGFRLWSFLFFCGCSHGLLDAMTTGGLGVAFFAPFNNERFFLPWRVIKVSPISVSGFFSEWGIRVLKSEMVWIGIPSLIIMFLSTVLHRALKKKV